MTVAAGVAGCYPTGPVTMPVKTPWSRLPTHPTRGAINVVVETPRGSSCKYKYDSKLGLFRLNRVLPQGSAFPCDYGFVPATRAGDGDPLDALLLLEGTAYPGVVVRARAIGILRAKKSGKDNHRVIAVAVLTKAYRDVTDIHHLAPATLVAIEQFFRAVLRLGRHEVLGFGDRKQAERVIEHSVIEQPRRAASSRGKSKRK